MGAEVTPENIRVSVGRDIAVVQNFEKGQRGHVRIPSKSRHAQPQHRCPLRANRRHGLSFKYSGD